MSEPKSKASQKQSQHSPLPWKIDEAYRRGGFSEIIRASNGKDVLQHEDACAICKTNRQLIVQAVNSHEVAEELVTMILNGDTFSIVKLARVTKLARQYLDMKEEE